MSSVTKKLILSIRRKALLIFVIFVFICQPLVVNGAEESISLKNETITPGSFYFSFKRLWEKGMEKLQLTRDLRINFYKSQLKIRLSELNYVVEKKLLGEVQQSTERFSYTAGKLTEELVMQNKPSEKEIVIKEFEKFQKYLDKLRDKYPANSSFWMLVQHDINTLKILSDKLE